jgi:hypothetical protein
MAENSNWLNFLSNPRSHYIKKSMFEILKERYGKHEQILERLSSHLIVEKDLKDFLAMIIDVYEIGFFKAVEDQKEQLKKLGLGVKITSRTEN